MAHAVKAALEELLRARQLTAAAPPLRGEERRLRPVATGISALDRMLDGGFPRGQLSEVHGPASAGRTGVVMALVSHATRTGALAAWVDPADRLDPPSSAEAGVDFGRLLWLRGEGRAAASPVLPRAVSATHTLATSGLFDVVVLDLAAVAPPELAHLPGPTWVRLQRAVEALPAAVILLAATHIACGAAGVSLALTPASARWGGGNGSGRLLHGLMVVARAGRWQPRQVGFELQAFA